MKDKQIVTYNDEKLKAMAQVGMKNVDPKDIRPPQILLTQKSSNFDQMVDTMGNNPKPGQFFDTGKLKILPEFECYFVFAAKSKYTDRNKPDRGELDQYKAVGVLDDGSIFGMTFRSSGLYTLSPLFSLTASQMRPMFSIRVKMETKKLENELGQWYVPVCRIVSMESDGKKLAQLEEIALQFDKNSDVVFKEDEEHVNPDDVPFS